MLFKYLSSSILVMLCLTANAQKDTLSHAPMPVAAEPVPPPPARVATLGHASTVPVLPNQSPGNPHEEIEYLDLEGERVATAAEAHHRREVSYRADKWGIIKEFYPSGVLMDYSSYSSLLEQLRHGSHNLYYDNGKPAMTEAYSSGLRQGEREMYYPDGTLRRRDFFENGIRKTGEYFTADGKPAPYLEAEEMPVYRLGGFAEVVKAVSQGVRYPKLAQQNDVQGKVIMAFNVTETGDIADIRVLVGVPFLSEAAVDAVKKLHRFAKPGRVEGVAVKVGFTVPVTFSIQ